MTMFPFLSWKDGPVFFMLKETMKEASELLSLAFEQPLSWQLLRYFQEDAVYSFIIQEQVQTFVSSFVLL